MPGTSPGPDRLLIINADDYGVTEPISLGILKAVTAGSVSSVSCMTNTPAFENTVEKIRDLDVDCGIHLNLNSGKPLSEPIKIPILKSNGNFISNPLSCPFFFFTAPLKWRQWVESEFKRQIERLLSKKIKITHLDSHYHIHVFPTLAPIVLKLADAYNIPFVRIPLEQDLWGNISSPSHGLISALAQRMARSSHLPRCNFYGLREAGHIDRSILEKIFQSLAPGVSELMVHPGYRSPENLHYYAEEPKHLEKELAAVTNPDLSAALKKYEIKLVRFRDLADTRKQSPS